MKNLIEWLDSLRALLKCNTAVYRSIMKPLEVTGNASQLVSAQQVVIHTYHTDMYSYKIWRPQQTLVYLLINGHNLPSGDLSQV